MPAAIIPFILDNNADFNETLIWTDADNNPINLTGWSAKMELANNTSAGRTIYYTMISSGLNPGIIITPLVGQIQLYIPETETATFTFAQAVYDLVLTAPGGETIRLIQGIITNSFGVTSLP